MDTNDRPPEPGHGRPREASLSQVEDPDQLAEALAERIAERLYDLINRPARTDGSHLLDVKDVARHLQVSKRTVETLIAEGQITPIWIRGQRRFTKEALDAYLRKCSRTEPERSGE
jgi:excisionase family DNA binding protein